MKLLQTLELILYPLIVVMSWILSAAIFLTSSVGVSIVLLSLVVFLAMRPLRKFAEVYEKREAFIQEKMAPDLREAKALYRGEERFNRIETIYKKNNYHPIKSMRSTYVFIFQIPFLLSALIFLLNNPLLEGRRFLFIENLAAPDAILKISINASYFTEINLLPIVIVFLSVLEILFLDSDINSQKIRKLAISIFIALIVYSLPSAIVLYWASNSLWSLLSSFISSRRELTEAGDLGDTDGQR